MPRLLLVDDNPSIHRIAESLLAPTDVELVCVDSAAEALDRIGRGERFDVALVDTAMPGMDGWTLLGRLRSMEATALMPIALIAGVLDPVDPAKLAKAPVQGFLKKPIELRELGDRVKALLTTTVTPVPSPFSTVPATPARELVKRAEVALPEFRHEPVDIPTGLVDVDLNLPEPEEDLLVLTPEDLWPEDSAPNIYETPGFTSAPPDVHLELEELDLDSLQDLGNELPVVEPASGARPEPVLEPEPVAVFPEEEHVTLSGLEDLDSLSADFLMVVPEPAPEAMPEPDDFLAHLPAAGTLIDETGVGLAAGQISPEPGLDIHEPIFDTQAPVLAHESAPSVEPPAPVRAPAAGGQTPAVPGQAAPWSSDPAPVSSEEAQVLLQAMLADPVLVDALAKAVVARMGDQVLREIAWEVMPDLAGRLQR
jgi:CheY-like chemotaxis protein